MEDLIKIKTIQFKRGSRANLVAKLRGDHKPLKGEPIFETDTNKLKIGDGEHDYEQLDYIIDTRQIAALIETATVAAENASSSAFTAVNAQIAAEGAARNAQIINDNAVLTLKNYVSDWFEKTFWHGTLEEYAELTEIDPQKIYFIEY